MYLLIALGLIVVFAVLFYVATLKRCDSNEVLIVSGKLFGANKGKSVAIYQGGTVNVIPLVQQATTLKLVPMNIDVSLRDALSSNNIRVDIPSNFQIAFSTEGALLENAAQRLIGLSRSQIMELALDIILGGMRAVIASLTIEEINQDREKFMTEIEKQVKPELDKLGLVITNVNIQDITDEAGYIEAIGKRAASQAVEKANIDVAEQRKLGAIGTAQQQTEQKVEVEKATTKSDLGVAETQKERTVRTAQYASETEKEKIEFEKQRVNAQAELEVEKAAANKKELVAQSQAQQAVLEQEKIEKQLELEKETIVAQEIAKREAILQAEAEAEEIKVKAQAEADAILAKYKAEAEGTKAVLDAKAEGYKNMFKDIEGSMLLGMEYLKIAPEMQEINAKAVSNIKIDNLDVIDSGSGQSVPNFMQNFVGALPHAHKVAENLGIKMPAFMGENKTPTQINENLN